MASRIPPVATRDTFAHTLGCPCVACGELRRYGPQSYGNPWARLLASPQFEKMASDAEAASRRYEMAQATRKAKSRLSIADRRRLAKQAA